MQNTQEKDLQKTKVDVTEARKVYVHRNKLCTRGHTPSSSGGRSSVVVRQAGRQMKYLQFTNILKFHNFNSKACLGYLNKSMVPIAFVQIDNRPYLKKVLL